MAVFSVNSANLRASSSASNHILKHERQRFAGKMAELLMKSAIAHGDRVGRSAISGTSPEGSHGGERFRQAGADDVDA